MHINFCFCVVVGWRVLASWRRYLTGRVLVVAYTISNGRERIPGLFDLPTA